MLKASSAEQQLSRIWIAARIAIVAIMIPTTLAFFLGGSYEVPEPYRNHSISAINLTGGVHDNLLPRSAIGSFTCIYYAGFFSIFAIRRKLFAGISKLQIASERFNHHIVYRSLTAQMLLPLVYLFANVLWILDMTGIVDSPILQRSVLIFSPVFALVSPLINMYYIPPYRQ
ncbi:hypothetical protein PENTCL1PPCAC_16439, partial [Pristionchus entomophagus]